MIAGLGLLGAVPWVVCRPLPSAPASPPPRDVSQFDAARALATARFLAATVGPRLAGSAGEWRAAAYLAGRLRALGYETHVQRVPLGPGATTCNVIGRRRVPGRPRAILIGAHTDSVPRPGCAGANDNASGVAVTLELARVVAAAELPLSLEVVFFGGEEQHGRRSLVGSAAYVASAARPRAMICLDMVGRGSWLRLVHGGPRGEALAGALGREARALGLPFHVMPGWTGSDYVSFAAAGVPAVWIQWLPDPDNHTARDTAARLNPQALGATGRLVAAALWHLSATGSGLPVTTVQRSPQVAAPEADRCGGWSIPREPPSVASGRRSVGGFYGRIVRAVVAVAASAPDGIAPGRRAEPHPRTQRR